MGGGTRTHIGRTHQILDREMVRMFAEVERKVRAAFLTEVDEVLATDREKGEVSPRRLRRAEIIREVAKRPGNHDNGRLPPDAA